MKTVLAAALALLAGLFLGGIGPRAELRRTQKSLEEARAAARASSSAALPLALALGPLAAARERAQAPVPHFVIPDGGAQADQRPRKRRSLFGGPDGGTEEFAQAKAAMDLRATQFKVAFSEEARLGPEREAALDGVIDTMNKELARAGEEIAKSLRERPEGQRLRPREVVDIGARMMDIYRRADDAFTASLDDAAKAARDRTQFDLLSQVDLNAFRGLGETIQRVGVTDMGRP
jgi:hypothetical protein